MFGIGNRSIVRVVFILLASSLLALTVSALAACGNRNETQTAAPAAPSDTAPAAQVADPSGEASVEAAEASDAAPAAQVVDSDGEASVEAAQPSGVEALLSGDTLARYRALPPAYRQALELYTHVGVSSELIPTVVQDKIDQWGDHTIPLSELVGDERVKRLERLRDISIPTTYGSLLAGYYVFLLNTEPDGQRRADAMRDLVDVMAPPPPSNTVGLDVDEATDPNPPPPPMLEWPGVETFLAPTALARLATLAPGLQEAIGRPLAVDPTGQVFPDRIKDVAVYMPMYEIFALKADADIELPKLENALTGEDRVAFLSFSAEVRERGEQFFRTSLVISYLTEAVQPGGAPAVSTWSLEILDQMAAMGLEYTDSISHLTADGGASM